MAQRGRRVARGANNNDHNDEENNLAAQIAALLRDGDRRRSVKVPRFDGRSSVAKFLEVFEEVRDINRWDDRETALQLKLALDGSARECVTGDTFEEMSDSLRARYELTQDMALRELKHLRFDNRSNIHEFGERVRHLVDVGYPALDDDQRVEIAIREVLDAIGDKVLRREFKWRQAQNFADALQRIQEYFSDMRADSRLRQADFGSDQDLLQTNAEAESFCLKGSIAGHPTMLVVDSGCTRSVIPTSLYEQLPLQIGSFVTGQDFLVIDKSEEALLGMDFFREHDCKLDFSKAVLQIGDLKLQCCGTDGLPY